MLLVFSTVANRAIIFNPWPLDLDLDLEATKHVQTDAYQNFALRTRDMQGWSQSIHI